MNGLHLHLEKRRGRPIVIEPMPRQAGREICGLWIETHEMDFIFHAGAASLHHRHQIILHEYAHMLLNHHEHGSSSRSVAALFPDLDPETVTRALSRGDITTRMESEAEALADMLAIHMMRQSYRLRENGNLGSLG